MKKNIILIILAAVVIGLGFLFFQNIYQKHIIFLKNNTEIIADETWMVGETLFYKFDNEVKDIGMPDVLYVKQGDTFDVTHEASMGVIQKERFQSPFRTRS